MKVSSIDQWQTVAADARVPRAAMNNIASGLLKMGMPSRNAGGIVVVAAEAATREWLRKKSPNFSVVLTRVDVSLILLQRGRSAMSLYVTVRGGLLCRAKDGGDMVLEFDGETMTIEEIAEWIDYAAWSYGVGTRSAAVDGPWISREDAVAAMQRCDRKVETIMGKDTISIFWRFGTRRPTFRVVAFVAATGRTVSCMEVFTNAVLRGDDVLDLDHLRCSTSDPFCVTVRHMDIARSTSSKPAPAEPPAAKKHKPNDDDALDEESKGAVTTLVKLAGVDVARFVADERVRSLCYDHITTAASLMRDDIVRRERQAKEAELKKAMADMEELRARLGVVEKWFKEHE